MKRRPSTRSLSRKSLPSDVERTPTAAHSILFSYSSRKNLDSVVVPETPNNSYHSITDATGMTASTVLETPDSPENTQTHKQSSATDKSALHSKVYSTSHASTSRGLDNEKKDDDELMSDVEESSILDITPDFILGGRRRNVMSILESEHSFIHSLRNQNKKNSSMLYGSEQNYPNVSPVKRRKRKSLAQVILPFDLNDSEGLSDKLQSIKKSECIIPKVKAGRCNGSANEFEVYSKTRRRSVKSKQTNVQSSSPLQDVNRRHSENNQIATSKTVYRDKKNDSDNDITLFFESEDLDITPLGSQSQANINKSVHDIIKGLESQDLFDSEKDDRMEETILSHSSKKPIEIFQLNKMPQKVSHPSLEDIAECTFEDTASNRSCSSIELDPTQPATKLILQGVVAYVEVRIGNDNHSEVIKDQLKVLGAQVKEKLTSDVTHVVFKDGNKATFNFAVKRGLHLVSSLWVEACRENFKKMSEALFPSGSMDSYKNPVSFARLRKLKSMQPKDFSEEERIASARVRRRLKTLGSNSQSPSFDDLGSITPRSSATSGDGDVNSPLFGISHLLTPQRRSPNSQSSCEEETSMGEEIEASFIGTPLSKRLYNRFLTPQREKTTQQKSSNGNKSHDYSKEGNCFTDTDDEASTQGNATSSKEASQNGNSDMDCEEVIGNPCEEGNFICVGDKSRSNLDSRSETNCDASKKMQQLPQQLSKPRRSLRLSQRFDIQTQQRPSESRKSGKKLYNVNQSSSRERKSERSKSDTTGTVSESSLNLPECRNRETSLNLPECRSRSTSSASSPLKIKGHRLLYVDSVEPSQELIVPTTPLHSSFQSHGPYAELLIHGTKTQRAALKELKGCRKSSSIQKKTGSTKCGRGKMGGSYRNAGTSSLNEVFFSSDEEQLVPRGSIYPLPKTRKSIEEFKLKKPLRGVKRSNLKLNSGKDSSICLTSIHSKEMRCIIPIIKKLGGYQITTDVNCTTTHVVCGEERRTLNLLFGIAQGSWIIDKSWLYESLEMSKWAPEEPFEMFIYCPGAKICREQREAQGASYKQSLFSGVGTVFVLEHCVPSSQNIKELLERCGCHVVPNIRNANIVVGNASSVTGARNRLSQVTHVSEKWVLDSIQYHKVQNIQDYDLANGINASISSNISEKI